MKFSRRCLCALLCLALLSGVFSVSVSASENKQVNITQQWQIYHNWSNGIFPPTFQFAPNNGETEKEQYIHAPGRYFNHALASYTIVNADGSPLFYSGKSTTIKFSNVYYSLLVNEGTDLIQYIRTPDWITAKVYYTDDTYTSVSVSDFSCNINKVSLTVVVEPKKDVKSVVFEMHKDFTDLYFTNVTAYLGETDGDGSASFHYEQQTEEAGLLSGILGWVKGIADKVTSGFEEVKNGFSSVINSIIELPTKLWEKISEGLKSLFIPSGESFQELKSKFDTLLSEKFGAIYQVGTIIFDFWENILIADERNAIDLPLTEIPIGDNKTFSFGGYSVQIVPDGFTAIAVTSKLITSIIATFVFMNALKRKYDELLRT